jgi:hypothetical protein
MFMAPNGGDAVIRISPDGEVSTLARFPNIASLAVSPADELFLALGDQVAQLLPDGRLLPLARGFSHPIGLAFDLAGNLYVSDEIDNSIVRIGGFPQGTLNGIVTDRAGKPLAGARVQVSADTPIVVGQVTIADADGRFSLPAAPRSYCVVVSLPGYQDKVVEGVTISEGQVYVLEVVLAPLV